MFKINANGTSSPIRIGDQWNKFEAFASETEALLRQSEDDEFSDHFWYYSKQLDARVLVNSLGEIFVMEFYAKPENKKFHVFIDGVKYSHKFSNLKEIASKGHEIWKSSLDDYLFPKLQLIPGFNKSKHDHESLVYASQAYFDHFDEVYPDLISYETVQL